MLTVDTIHSDFYTALEAAMRIMRVLGLEGFDSRAPFRIMPQCDDLVRVSGEDWAFTLVQYEHGWGHKGFTTWLPDDSGYTGPLPVCALIKG